MSLRSLLVAFVLACALLAAVYTPFQAQADDVRLTTTRQALVFAGPGEPYPLLITFGAGVTLPVVARSEETDWLIVAVGPFREGWVAALDGELSASAGDLSVRYPDLALLPTPTAVKSTLRVYVTLTPAKNNTAGVQINLSVVEENVDYRILIYAEDGKLMREDDIHGNYGAKYLKYQPGSFPHGRYSVVVTASSGETARTQFLLEKP